MVPAGQPKLSCWNFLIKMLIMEKKERKKGKVSSEEKDVFLTLRKGQTPHRRVVGAHPTCGSGLHMAGAWLSDPAALTGLSCQHPCLGAEPQWPGHHPVT